MTESAATVVTSPRRYYLLKAYAAEANGDGELALAWLGKQAAINGASLATDFPHAAALDAAHYSTTEDLDGATSDELVTNVALTRKQADAVIAALED